MNRKWCQISSDWELSVFSLKFHYQLPKVFIILINLIFNTDYWYQFTLVNHGSCLQVFIYLWLRSRQCLLPFQNFLAQIGCMQHLQDLQLASLHFWWVWERHIAVTAMKTSSHTGYQASASPKIKSRGFDLVLCCPLLSTSGQQKNQHSIPFHTQVSPQLTRKKAQE